jgi:hypothetical protein
LSGGDIAVVRVVDSGCPRASSQEKAPGRERVTSGARNWNDIGRKLIAMAEDFPEDKYEFKPNPSQRTFAEQLLHASGVNYFFTNVVNGEKPPPNRIRSVTCSRARPTSSRT